MDGSEDLAEYLSIVSRWLDRGLAACLERPAVSPDFLTLVESLPDRGWTRPGPRPKLEAELIAGWEAVARVAPATAQNAAEFCWGVAALCAEGIQRAPHLHRIYEISSRLEAILRKAVGQLYGTSEWCFTTPHPFYLAAEEGSLAQLQAAARWCRPGPKAIRRALDLATAQVEPEALKKTDWLLGQVVSVDLGILRRALYHLSMGADPELYRSCLIRRLAPAEAAELRGKLVAERLQRAPRPWARPPRSLMEARFGGALAYIMALELRFVWVGAVVRAPRASAF